MGLKSVVFVALVAYAYSGPVNLNRPSSETNRCAQRCTDKSKFQYTVGSIYEFRYEGETRTGIQGASEDKAGLKITTTAEIEVVSKCDLVLTLTNAAVYGSDPENPQNLHQRRSPEFSQALEQHPLWFSFQDGIVEELCPSDDDSAWVLNVKRGILSAFQNTMNSFENNQELTETDVTGKCKTTYTVTQQGWRTVAIKKSKDIMSCTDRHGYETAMQSAMYRLPSSFQSLPLMKTTHECDQVINTDGHIQSVLCHETHLFRPFSKDASGALTEVTQKLNYVRMRTASIVSNFGSITRREKLTFQHTGGEETKTMDYQGAVDKLQELCQNTQNDIRPETPQLFSELVYLMKKLDAVSLDAVYRQVSAATFCPNNAERVKKFYVDAIPMVGTGAAVRQITQLILNNDITGVFAEMWLASLAFIHHPTKDMISEISTLLTMDDSTKVLLPISALINSYCKINPECGSDVEVDSVITKLQEFLGSNCDVTVATYTKVLLSLRAIGNIGHAQRLTVVLDNCIAKKDNPMEIRVAAVDAYRRLSCGADRNNLMIVYRDSDEDAELRIAAYLQVMQCPTEYIISQIKETLASEEVNQVGSFVWTHLTNLMESSTLYKQSVSAILQDERLQKEFDLDKRKFSRNYEWSYFSEKFNSGASLESNLIWSPKSFVPRSVMANLTVDMFGHSVNLLEIGGRVEGLEHLLEAYFGPTGIYNIEKGGEDDSVPQQSSSRSIKMPKLNRMDQRFGAKVDELKAALYMRVFGNEVKYSRLGDKSERSQINMVEILMNLAKQRDMSHSINSMFLDSSIIIPTMIGLPLNLTVNGTSTVDMKTSGKMDLQHGNHILIEGVLQPSGAVQISSIMSVDAFVTKSGMKMSSTLHSSTSISGKIELKNKQVLKLELNMPQDRLEILNVKSSFFAIHGDQEQVQNMIADNRVDKSFCSWGATISRVTGMNFCGQIQYPNASMVDDAPYFPFTGPFSLSINMEKRDTHTGYKFEAKKVNTRQKFVFSLKYDTPGSRVDRATGFDIEVNHKSKAMEMNMKSPWKKATFTGNLVNKPVLKKVSGTVTVDDTKEYGVLAQLRRAETRNAITYTPNIEIRIHDREPLTLTGSMQYQKKKSFVSSIKINNVLTDPIILDSSIKYTDKEKGIKGTFSYQKDRQYAMEARVMMTKKKKKATYNPILAISTPDNDLVDLRGSIDTRAGKSIKFDLTLDRVFTVPMTLKGDGSVYVKGNRIRYKGRYNFKGPKCNMRMRFNIDKRANVISTLFQTDYNFAKYMKWAKDGIRFDSKLVNKGTKTMKNMNLVTNFKSARFADYNNRVVAKLAHRNNRQTEFDATVHYGKKYTKKDNKKYLALEVISQYRNTKVRFNAAYNVTFRYPFKNLDMAVTGRHTQDKKSVTSTMDVKYNSKKNIDIALNLYDKSKQFPKYSGDVSVKYEGRHLAAAGQYVQNNKKMRSTKFSIQHQTDQVSTFEGIYKHKTETEHEISSEISIFNKKPIAIRSGADFTTLTPKFYTDFRYGRNVYGWNIEGEYDNGTYAKLKADIKYPTNNHTVEIEGGKKLGKYVAKFQMDTNLDENNRYQFEAGLRNSGINDFEGSATFQIPGRMYSGNVRHQGGEDGYNSHLDVTWAPRKTVTADFIFADDKRRYRRTTDGSFSLTTPFQRFSEFKIAAGHTSNRRQYSSQASVSLNRSPYSLAFTTKKPLQLNDIELQISLTTPSREIGNPTFTLRHVLNDDLSSSAALTWGRGHRVSVDTSGTFQYRRSRRNWVLNLGVTSSFQGYESMLLNITHEDNLQKFTSRAVFDHNGIEYLYTFNMNHNHDGWQIQNSGDFDIRSPYDTLSITWSHRNSDHDYRCSATADWGNGQRFTANMNGEIQVTDLSRKILNNIDIQTPSDRIRSITSKFEHEDRKGYIKSEGSVLTNGRNAGTVAMNYGRLPGSVDFDFTITSIHMEDFHAIVKSRHAVLPYTGEASVEWAPMQKIELDGTFTHRPDFKVMDGRVTLRTPFPRARNIVTRVERKIENGEMVERTSVEFAPGQQIVREDRIRWDTVKKYRIKITTPFPQFSDLDLGFSFTGDQNNFDSNADFKVIPYVQKISAVASWQARRLQGNFRLNTPFPQYPYMSAEVSSGQLGQARTSKIVVEYLPRQKVEIDTSYSLTGQELDATLNFKSPFTSDVYSSYRHTHQDKSLTSHAEIQYRGDQRVILDLGYDLEPTISGNFQMTSPIRGYETVKLGFNHDGHQWHDFHTNVSYETNGDKLELEAKLDLTNGYKGKATITSPFEVKKAQAIFNHEGSLISFRTHGEVTYNDDKAESDVRFSHDPTVTSGLFTFKNSFIRPLEDIHLSFGKDGTPSDLTLGGEFGYEKGKRFTGTFTNQKTVSSLTSNVVINTPLTEPLKFGINHNNRRKGFHTVVEASAGTDNVLKGETTFKLRNYKLDVTHHFTGVIDGENQDLLVTVAHDGKPKKFNCEVEGTYNGKKVSILNKVDVRSVDNLQISVRAGTPFEGYEDSSFTFSYVDSGSGKTTEIVGIFNNKEMSYHQVQNGLSMDNYEQTTTIKTPFESYREHISKFSSVKDNSGYTIVIDDTTNGKEKKMHLNFDVSSIDNPHGSVTITTPYENYESMSASFRGNKRNAGYTAEARAALKDQRFTLDATFDGVTIDNLQGSVVMTTPFENYRDMSASFKSIKDDNGLNNELSITYAPSKTIMVTSRLDLEAPDLSGNFHIETPFEELHTGDAEFSHQGTMFDFRSMAMIKSSRFEPQKVEWIVKTPDHIQFEGIDITLKLPIGLISEESENAVITLKTDKKAEEFSLDLTFFPGEEKKMTLTCNWKLINRPSASIMSTGLDVTTPFRAVRAASFKIDHFNSASRTKEIISIEHNGKKYLDLDARINHADDISGNINIRHPREMEYTFSGSKSGITYTGETTLNWDATQPNSRIRLEGTFNGGSRRQPFRDITVRAIHPTRTVSAKGAFDQSRQHISSNMEFSWDESARKSVGFDFQTRKSDSTDYSLKVTVPSRAVKVTSQYSDSTSKTVESSVFWDADRDTNKRVTIRMAVTPGQNSYDSTFGLELPTFGEAFSLRRNVRMSDGNILHDCRTEFSYAPDVRKTVVITTRLEDTSVGSAKNYSFTVGLAHAHTNIDMSMTGHIGDSTEKRTAGLNVNYLTARRQRKNLLLIGEIDKLRKQLNVQVFAPEKSFIISGQVNDNAPYSLQLTGSSDTTNVIDTRVTLDPSAKSITLRMKYDTENPNSVLHMSARYPSPMDIEAEMYRTGDFRQITDTLLSVHLKSTRLLNTRIHWRPQMLEELVDYGSAMVKSTGQHVSDVAMEITNEVGKEIERKLDAISNELTTELKPISDELTEQMAALQSQLNSIKRELKQMYKRNALYMQDINELCNNAVADFITKSGRAMRTFKRTYTDMRNKVEELTNEIQNYPIKDKYEECIEVVAEKLKEYKTNVQLFIDEEIELAIEKMKEFLEMLKEKVENFSDTIKEKISEKMDEISQHTDFQELKAELEALLDRMPNLPELPDINFKQYVNKIHEKIKTALRNIKLAEHYETLVNKGHEFLNTHLGDLMAEEKIQKMKEMANKLYQQSLWAYRYLAIEEYLAELMSDIYNSTKQFITEDIAQLRILHWDKSRIIVFDPENGNIEFDLYLPTPLEALDRLPRFNYMKYVNRIKNFVDKYIPKEDFCLWDLYYKYKPSLNPREWIPPFDSYAVISGGQHFITFDNEQYDFMGRCSYVLTRDLIDNNFTVILNYNGNARNPEMESLLVMAEGQTVELFTDFTIKANERRHELPFIAGRLSVVRVGNQIRLDSGRGLTITGDLLHDHFVIGISGWYFGKVAGLLGTYNNEQYDEMVLNNGQITTDIDQLRNSWEVSRRCRADRNLATPITISETATGYAECSALFNSSDSSLRPCYKQVDPESFMHICMGNMLSSGDICKSTSLYVQSCQLKGVNIWIPQQCVKCSAPNDEVYHGGDTIKLSPASDDYNIPKSADIIFVVEVKQCNQDVARKLGSLVYKIEQGLQSDRITENRYGLISYGTDSLHSHTIEGQLFNDGTKFTKGVESLQFGNHRTTDPLNAILSASNFPFRSGVSKSVILIQCGECGPSEKTNPIYLKHVLSTRDITLHILRNQDFRLSGNQSPKQKILGMDNDRKYVSGQPRDMSPYDDLVIPGDNCAALALRSNGSIFDSAGFSLPKLQDKKEFMNIVSERVSKSAIPSGCQVCQCVADDNGAARPVCRKCYSSISDYMPHWWSTLKHPAAIQDAFEQQFREYVGDSVFSS